MNRRSVLKLIPVSLAMVPLGQGLIVPALAADAKSMNGEIEVRDAWARASRSNETSAYLEIVNRAWSEDKLTSVRSPVAERCILQQSKWKGMNMHLVDTDEVTIASMGKVRLKPGGIQIQVVGLARGLSNRDELPLVLTFENAGRVEIVADVTSRMLGPARLVSDHNG